MRIFLLLSFIFFLYKLNGRFLKENDQFCIGHIFREIPKRIKTEGPKFHYLGKGHQSFVFESEDGTQVIKFYRYPSHLRAFSLKFWSHPKEIYNIKKLHDSLESYKLAFSELKEDCGLLDSTFKSATLIDKSGAKYTVSLDDTTCFMQKKAGKIFPVKGDATLLFSSLIDLIKRRTEKGIVDLDPVLKKNYGVVDGKVILIDIGRLKRQKADLNEQIEKIAEPLMREKG